MVTSNDERVQVILQHLDITLEDFYTVTMIAEKLNKSNHQIYEYIEKFNITTEVHKGVKIIKGSSIVETVMVDYDYSFDENYLTMSEIEQQYKDIFRRNDVYEIPKKVERISTEGLPLSSNGGFKYRKDDIEKYYKDKHGDVPRNVLSEILNSGEYMTLRAMAIEIGCSNTFIKNNYNNCDKVYVTPNNVYIHKKNLRPLKELYAQYLREKTYTPIQYVEMQINEHSLVSTFPHSTELFIQYAKKVLNTSRTKQSKELANLLVRTYDYLISSITKEFTKLTDKEILVILSKENVSFNMKKHIPPFFKWVSHKVSNVSYREVPVISIKRNPNSISTYSAVDFYKMYDFVGNVDIHVEKAIKDFSYAQYWFVACMNFTNAWRKTDIVDFPSPHMLVLNKQLSLDWFANNKLTVSDSQKIINEIIETNNFIINKTGALNKLYVHQDMLIPFATALCITELHREAKSASILLPSILNKSSLKLQKFFPSDYPKYSHLKVTKTLLTNLERAARDIGNLGGVSNVISSRLRGHKDLNSIAYYVGLDSVNEPVEASRHLFRRGHFGYLYSLLVDLINPNVEFTMEEKTDAIEVIKEYFTPLQVENNSQFFLLQQQRQNSISELILKMDNLSIMETLNAIYHNNQPARIKEAQCFSETCINPQSDCLNCPLLVPKTFMLQELKEEIEQLLYDLQNNISSNSLKAQKLTYLLLVRLNLINEASKTFGKDYINVFIDLKDLKMKISNVQNLLDIKEGS